MKRIVGAALVVLFATFVILSCKKMRGEQSGDFNGRLSNRSSNGPNALELVSCYETLPSTISTSRTLNPDSAYLIPGCVKVANGATLTAPAGTVFLGQKSTNGTLVIERGGKLIANGTASDPVVFTSDQAPNSRAVGDWGGVIMLGKADNNGSSATLTVDRACGTFTAGAVSGITTDSDDSGSLSYVQIHYAGGFVSGDEYPSGLLLMAVGSNTDFSHIQISKSKKDGLITRGGTFNSNYVANYDNYKDDFIFQDGYRGNMQYALSLRRNSAAHDAATSNAFVIMNNENGNTNTPNTNAVISDASIYGPSFCGGSPHSDFKNGVLFKGYAKGGVFNSVIAGWPQGLLIDGATTIQNANADLLLFSNNTFYNYGSNAARFASNPLLWDQPGNPCIIDNLPDWIINPNNETCGNFGYQAISSGFNYSASVCDDYCEDGAPTFTLSSAGSLASSTYPSGTMLDNGWFNTTSKPRGAFGTASDWTSGGWTEWCAISVGYCL